MRSTPAVLALAVLAVSASGCDLEAPADPLVRRGQPLIGGAIDDDDPGAVALLAGTSNDAFCTGTMISPSVVLTAAHCVDMLGGDPTGSIFFGTDTLRGGARIGMADAQYNLAWDGNVGSNDIALIRIEEPADPFIAVPLNTTPLDELVGASYRHVGFGKYDPGINGDGKKRTASTTISALVAPDIVQSGDADVRVCFGDSGGPGLLAFDEDGEMVERITGVHSYTTGELCNAPNGDTRVDLFVDDFILPWVQANDPTCGADDLCAPIGCEGDPDCEPCGRDGNCTDGCALPDPDCPTSALGEICRADTQCDTGLCVFWQDDLEFHFCSQSCEGGGSCPAGMSCQTVAPFGDICYFDEAPAGVLGDACEQATDCGSYVCDDGECVYACDLSLGKTCPLEFECEEDDGGAFYCRSTKEEGGCGCQAGPRESWAGFGLLVAAALWTLRRRRGAPRAG
jgi:MYXO-CTERM domain-containing protein